MRPSAALPIAAYRPRRTGALGVREIAGWQVKLIGITAGQDLPGAAECEAAVGYAARRLPQPPDADGRSGVAFLVVHHGLDALWVIVGWWQLDLLFHEVARAELGTTRLGPVPPDGPSACVWELAAIDHERRAWISNVLERPADPDLAGYLAAAPGSDGTR